MIRKLLLFIFLAFTFNTTHAQFGTFKQYFDGHDTLASNSIIVHLDTSSSNIWQIGPPQKSIFDSAATLPNAMVTDTINTYPVNNVSSFYTGYNIAHISVNFGVLAFRWKQKLDLDSGYDGGIVEFSLDTGATWQNAFNNQSVYNFYGFQQANKDTLATGEYAFSGTDSVWRDIWFCFRGNLLAISDSIIVRYTLKTDSVDNNKEGWLIDNMLTEVTYFHTVSKIAPGKTFIVYPTLSSGIITVNSDNDVKQLKSIKLIDASGKVIREYKNQPKKVQLNFSDCAPGNYYLDVQTNDKTEVHKFVIVH